MYTSDAEDKFADSAKWLAGSGMGAGNQSDNTNTVQMMNPDLSPIASYVRSVDVYKCPGDIYSAANGPRVRSISFNGALGGKPTVQGANPGGRKYYGGGAGAQVGVATKMSKLTVPGPSQTWVVTDEHWDSLNDAIFMFDPGYPQTGQKWRDLPGSYHNNAGEFSFADGHSEIRKWKQNDPVNKTFYPVRKDGSSPWTTFTITSVDYEWVQDRMPYER
jgi:hypothetical protein